MVVSNPTETKEGFQKEVHYWSSNEGEFSTGQTKGTCIFSPCYSQGASPFTCTLSDKRKTAMKNNSEIFGFTILVMHATSRIL